MHRIFHGYAPFKGPLPGRQTGVLVSSAKGRAVAYALWNLEARGTLFVEPGMPVYGGMIVGEHARPQDLDVNPLKSKQLTNIRAAGKDNAVRLSPPRPMPLEIALAYLTDDELLEVTPESIRLRKRLLDPHARRRAARRGASILSPPRNRRNATRCFPARIAPKNPASTRGALPMPVIRVEVPRRHARRHARVHPRCGQGGGAQDPRTQADQVRLRRVREVVAEIGDGVPLVEVDLRPGREPERKKALVDAIAEILNDAMGVDAADIYVVFRENPPENHYCGGTPLPPWVPADA